MYRLSCSVLIFSFALALSGCNKFEDGPTGIPSALPGNLDTTYGSSGISTTAFNGTVQKLLVLADNTLLVAGTENNSGIINYSFLRFDTAGALVNSFGTSGKAATGLPIGKSFVVQSTGKIMVGGASLTTAGGAEVTHYQLRRLNPDGSLDTSFNSGGSLMLSSLYSPDNFALATIQLQSDDKIILAGTNTVAGSSPVFSLARINTDGSLDTSFATVGRLNVVPAAGAHQTMRQLLVQQDSNLVLGGNSCGSPASDPLCPYVLMRYGTDGSLDTSFGSAGVVTTGGTSAGTLAQESNGQLVLGTASAGFDGITRYFTNGTVDYYYGSLGETNSPGTQFKVDASDNLVVLSRGYQNTMVLSRLLPSGLPDTTYTKIGIEPKLSTLSAPKDLVIDSEGKIIVGGSTGDFTGAATLSIILERYLP